MRSFSARLNITRRYIGTPVVKRPESAYCEASDFGPVVEEGHPWRAARDSVVEPLNICILLWIVSLNKAKLYTMRPHPEVYQSTDTLDTLSRVYSVRISTRNETAVKHMDLPSSQYPDARRPLKSETL